MIVDITLPEISENVDSGDVVKLLVSPGDAVEVDTPLIELETDKAVFEVPSTAAGKVAELSVKVGDEVSVGGVIAKINTAGAGAAPATPEKAEAPEAAPTAADSAPAPPAPAKAPPAAPTPPAPAPAAVDDGVSVAVDTVKPATSADPPPASPTVRRVARELGIAIHDVKGSGPGGRISSEDVHRYAKSIITGAASAPAAGPIPGAPLPDFTKYGDIERLPMTKIRKVTAANMARAWQTVPAVTQNDEADITELEAARKRYQGLADKSGGKLTMTAILLKVCASALKRFPEFNASIDAAASEVILKKYYNVGVAVDTDNGLLVPVIRDVDRKNVVTLAAELADVAARARDRKLTPSEMEGANFTISNLGGIGGTSFSPIVNTPEVAILGVSRAKMQPVFIDGEFEARLMMPLSLTYDHRLIDGAAAARFVRWVCEALEDPILLAIDG